MASSRAGPPVAGRFHASAIRSQPVRWKIARRHLNPVRKHRWRWIVAFLLLLSILTSGAAAAGGAYFVSQLPSASRFHVRYAFQDARIYDSAGDLLYNMADLRKNGGQRVVEPLQARHSHVAACAGGVNRIPLLLQNATIATEDATFYKNPGFDALSIMRAAYQDVRYGHIVSGASTITQQVVRMTMLNDQRTIKRKADEVALAYEITQRYSKRTILRYYLNSVNYGNLAYGAQAAARVYFGENVCRLDQAQAALLAGLPRAPTLYDPVINRHYAMIRMREVVKLMRRHGYLHSWAQEKRLFREARSWHFSSNRAPMRYPQFTRYVINQLQNTPQLRRWLYKGIDVYTTLNPRLQNLAQQQVTTQIDSLTSQHVTDGALVSLDLRPWHYGWILAMVGSAHYRGRAGQINMAISPRQPGSSMKPFNYIWALSHGGVGPGTTVSDSPVALPDPGNTVDGGWFTPTDYDHQWHGNVTLRQALANSLNVPAVKVEYYLTSPHNVAQTALHFGMTHLYRDNPGLDCNVCYAVTLGGLAKGTRLMEETAAYGVFATGGRTVPPIAIWKVIKRGSGRVLYCSSHCPKGIKPSSLLHPAPKHVLDPAHAYEITSMLSDNNARCTIQVCEFGLNSPLELTRPAAAKTGTTNNWTDNWTVGYTPQMVTGVWTGNADRSPMVNVIGITGAAPIWHNYMQGAFSILRLPVRPFVRPPGVTVVSQCTVPGSSSWQSTVPDLYVPGGPLNTRPLCSIPERGYDPALCTTPLGQPGYLFATGASCIPVADFPNQPAAPGAQLFPYYGSVNGSASQPAPLQPPVVVPPPLNPPAPPPAVNPLPPSSTSTPP